jgi:hypothetical protein
MKQMSRSSDSNHSGKAHPWLQEQVYAPRRQRSVDLVKRSVDILVREQKKVSVASIVAKSKEIDSDGLGISESTILNNNEARTYYEQHRTWKGSRNKRSVIGGMVSYTANVHIKADRDIAGVRQRYMRMSKHELIERLLAMEQACAEQEERWLQVNDDLLEWRIRAAQAEARLERNSADKVRGATNLRESTSSGDGE